MDLEVEMFRGCGWAVVGLWVAGVGRKVWGCQVEDACGAEHEPINPVFTNPAWPELQWRPQPGWLTAVTPSCSGCRRMRAGCLGGGEETLSRRGPATGQRSQLRGPLGPWLGREMSACGSQSIECSGVTWEVYGQEVRRDFHVVSKNIYICVFVSQRYSNHKEWTKYTSTLFNDRSLYYTFTHTLKGR